MTMLVFSIALRRVHSFFFFSASSGFLNFLFSVDSFASRIPLPLGFLPPVDTPAHRPFHLLPPRESRGPSMVLHLFSMIDVSLQFRHSPRFSWARRSLFSSFGPFLTTLPNARARSSIILDGLFFCSDRISSPPWTPLAGIFPFRLLFFLVIPAQYSYFPVAGSNSPSFSSPQCAPLSLALSNYTIFSVDFVRRQSLPELDKVFIILL